MVIMQRPVGEKVVAFEGLVAPEKGVEEFGSCLRQLETFIEFRIGLDLMNRERKLVGLKRICLVQCIDPEFLASYE